MTSEERAARAAEIVSMNGVAARNSIPKIDDVLLLLAIERMEHAGKGRAILLDVVARRMRNLPAPEITRAIVVENVHSTLAEAFFQEFPATSEAFVAEVRVSGEQGFLCAEIAPADRPGVNHDEPEPLLWQGFPVTPAEYRDLEDAAIREHDAAEHPADPATDAPVQTCTRCKATSAVGDAEIERVFGFRMVPKGGERVRRSQPQCRRCRNLPPARDAKP